MKNILKVGMTVAFLKEPLPHIVIGSPNGEKKAWANGDDKLVVEFIKNNNDFFKLMFFLLSAFGYRFEKTKCLYGEDVPVYKIVGINKR